jgi:hypothetical protein
MADPRNRDRFAIPAHSEACAGDVGDHEACTGTLAHDPTASHVGRSGPTPCRCPCHVEPWPFEHDG